MRLVSCVFLLGFVVVSCGNAPSEELAYTDAGAQDRKSKSSALGIEIPPMLISCEIHKERLQGSQREGSGSSSGFESVEAIPENPEFGYSSSIRDQFDVLAIRGFIENESDLELVGLRWHSQKTRFEIYVKTTQTEKIAALENFIKESSPAIKDEHLLVEKSDSNYSSEELIEIKRKIFTHYSESRQDVVDVSLAVDETCGKILITTTTSDSVKDFERAIVEMAVDPEIVGIVVDPDSGFTNPVESISIP